MTMVMIPQEEWQSLNDKLDRLAEMIENRNASDRDAEWLESEAARKLLGVSSKTWQNYRDQRVIPFSQIGRKIYVNRADLDAFLRSHRIEGNKQLFG
ncbi:DNA-binding protein [Muribaculaceae bacterium Isolate-002 (NCI)]|nr:DNA-binding protein [Muribaculaceae bacterium Isolate-002 (NCI)]